MWSSEHLREGDVYTRAELRALFAITDATINTGIFRPTGHDSIWLFITARKPVDRTPYADHLSGDVLAFGGQTSGRTDPLIIAHERRGLELLLFHRQHRGEFPGAGFRYEGRFRYVSHSGGQPTRFVAERVKAAAG
jgi:hypothetical protein